MPDGCQTIALKPHQLSVSTIVKPSITRRACAQRLNACRRYGGERITPVAKCAAAPSCDPSVQLSLTHRRAEAAQAIDELEGDLAQGLATTRQDPETGQVLADGNR
jgi:hypothetical protein